jgi:endogenous inhibitor of DNA gyrase (YacG/DUF329 family)
MTANCPICRKPVETGSPAFPFCSDRCRIIDLGNWASEKYVISTPAHPSEIQETLKEDQGDGQK